MRREPLAIRRWLRLFLPHLGLAGLASLLGAAGITVAAPSGPPLTAAPPAPPEPTASARSPEPSRAYVIDSWETGDGLPENSATAMAQDRTGYLWFGTFDGLVRFDGVRFEVFDRTNTGSAESPGLPDSRIANLHLDRLDRLWVSTVGGLVRRDGAVWRAVTADDGWRGDAVRSFTERADGAMLLTTFDGRVFEFDGTRFTELPEPPAVAGATPPSTAMVGAVDAQGRWWVARRGFVGTWDSSGRDSSGRDSSGRDSSGRDGSGRDGSGRDGTAWRALDGVDPRRPGIACASARDGGVWLVSGETIRKYRDRVEAFTVDVPSLPTGIWSLFEDSAGHLWVSTIDSGVHRITFDAPRETRPAELPERAASPTGDAQDAANVDARIRDPGGARRVTWDMDGGLTHNAIRFVFEDREHNLWVGSSGGGLMRFRDRRVAAFTRQEGLLERVVRSVWPTTDGGVLVGTYGKGLFRIEDEQATQIPVTAAGMTPQYIQSVHRDRAGRTWIGTFADGLFVIDDDGTRRIELPPECGPNVLALFEDRAGRIWVSGELSIAVIDDGRATVPPAAVGRPLREVIAFAELDDGSILFTNRRAVHRLEPSPSGRSAVDSTRLVEVRRPDGTPLDDVASLHPRADGSVWMGTARSGLLRWSPDRLETIDERSGLPARGVYGLLDDAHGHCWIATNRGIVRVRRDDLEALAEGTGSTARWIRLGPDDGMPSLECSGGRQPVCGTDPSGRLWFATPRGVAMVDPATFVANDLPPPLVIESVSFVVVGDSGEAEETRVELTPSPSPAAGGTAGATVARTASITLPPNIERLEIRYTALSLCDPAATPFRVMMEGLDRSWREVGTARSVDYDRPPPGHYRFRMRAANNDGLWAEHAASVDLALTPTLWQRRWVQAATALGVVFTCIGGAWWIAQLRFERRKAQERERELQLNQLAHLSRVAVLGELSGALAHELNQPLTAILSNAQAAQRLMRRAPDETIDLAEVRAIIGDIIDQDKRAGEVIHRLRTLLRKGESELRPVRVDEIVREATGLVHNELMGHGVEVRIEMARDLPMILGDRVQLQQVLVNLLVNADDAMQESTSGSAEGRRIVVGAAALEDVVAITVSDCGPGLGPEAIARLFEPFFTTKSKGLGLGLAICRSIIEAHAGSLTAENRPEGGALFRFELPAHRGECS